MSTDHSFQCAKCRKYKTADEYGTRKTGGSQGQKGDRLVNCLSCNANRAASRKRKRDETYTSHQVKRFAMEPPASPDQFVNALTKHASAAKIDESWRVSFVEVTLTDKGIANQIASLVWKATGYRFSFLNSYLRPTARFTYECCQAKGTSNDRDKQSAVSEENQRIARRMERFDCHGRLHVTLRNGVTVVTITHQRSHKKYVNIDLPESTYSSIGASPKGVPTGEGSAHVCSQ